MLATALSISAPALAQEGEDEVFHYLIPLAEAVNLSESGQHKQVISKTTKLLSDLSAKKNSTPKIQRPLPILRGDTSSGDTYRQVQAEALALKGLSGYTLKQTPQAVADLKKASAVCPDNAHVLSDLGTVYIKTKKTKDGIAVLTRAIKLNPNIREAYFMRAAGYQQIGKPKEAQADLKRAQRLLNDQQKNIDSLTERIEKLVQENKITEAIALDRQLIQAAPRDGLAITGYADHLTTDGKHHDALKYVSTAIALDPSNGYPYRIRSVINSRLQKQDLELRDANKAFNIEPRSMEALNSRAIANLDADRPVQAIRDFDLLVNRRPDFADAYINRSAAYLRIGETEKAVKDAKRAVALTPASPYGYQILGAALRRAGKLNEAREALEVSLRYKKVASADSVAMAQFNLGAVRLALKDPKANESLDAAIQLAPTLPEILFQRGAYNAYLGKIDDAIKILTKKQTRNADTSKVSKLVRRNQPAPKPKRLTDRAAPKLPGSSQKSIGVSSVTKTIKPGEMRPPVQKTHVPKPASAAASRAPKIIATPPPITRKFRISEPDLQDCVLIANRVIQLNPSKFETYNLRGLAHLCLEQYDQALSDFKKLSTLAKPGTPKQRAMVLCYLTLERLGKANDAKLLLNIQQTSPTGTASGGGSASVPTLRFLRNEIAEPMLFAGTQTPKELTRIHSYLAFHYNSIADTTKAAPHARWVLDRGDVSAPELILTTADETARRATTATPHR